MATQSVAERVALEQAPSASFVRFGGVCAILAAVIGLLYAVAFVALQDAMLYSLFLLLSGLVSSAALAALYQQLAVVESGFALWALVLGIIGSIGAAIHGGYDLANAINPPSPAGPALPNAIDPRGLLTFGVAGLSVLINAWLITRSQRLPKGLGYLGFALAALLLTLYFGRLIVLDPTSPIILVPVLLSGFLINPAWYAWLGLALLNESKSANSTFM